jgi:hypothetical protein
LKVEALQRGVVQMCAQSRENDQGRDKQNQQRFLPNDRAYASRFLNSCRVFAQTHVCPDAGDKNPDDKKPIQA